jgi:hypothetical protein
MFVGISHSSSFFLFINCVVVSDASTRAVCVGAGWGFFSVWSNIHDCIPLAQEDPATLVRTLEVIEMEDRAQVCSNAPWLARLDTTLPLCVNQRGCELIRQKK